jgi:AraC-like DNA-binding protein
VLIYVCKIEFEFGERAMELDRIGENVDIEVKNDSKNSDSEPDLPPEYCHYRDEGCELASSCLNCPFDECIYEKSGGKQRWLKSVRDKEMARLFIDEGKKAKELAQMFGISQRTVQRALKKEISLNPSFDKPNAGSFQKGDNERGQNNE